jgi:hypothetical protein
VGSDSENRQVDRTTIAARRARLGTIGNPPTFFKFNRL